MSSEKAENITSENISSSGLAGRYAVALFELAVEEKSLETVADELASLRDLLSESEELQLLTTSPIISRAEQAAAMSEVMDAGKFSKTVVNFIGVVTANRRLDKLNGIINEFNRMHEAYRGEVNASVVTAHKLDKNQLDALSAKLKLIVGRDVNVETEVDEDLLGGMVVRLGSRMIDSSLKTKLANLEATMKEVG